MVVKIAADDDDGKKTEKNIFIGRDKEINEIIGDLKDNKSNRGTRLLLVGESGIGKSALLDEIHRRLTEDEEDRRNRVFVGYYSKKESLIAESESLLYPFSIVLKSLINSAKESQQLGEKIDGTMARVKKGLLKFGKEQGIKIGVAIIEDVANKVGLGQTLEVGKDILKAVGSEKTSLMLAQQYIADHRDEARQSYLEIFKAIADEFKERRFVLILDQFESVGKASTDFFLNFVKLLSPQERFDIIVSFRTDDTTWNDSAARKVYEDLERKMTFDLNAKKISIEGLSVEDIGKWIKQVRGISLPLIPDLQRIKENSAGFPLVLDEWIKSSNDLNDYDKIKRDKLCTLIIGLEDGLTDEDQVRLDRMCILPYPLKLERLATYLQMNGNVDLVTSFVKRLSRYKIFDQDLEWFRHELIRRCFEDRLGNQRRSGYHQRAAEFFESLIEEEKQRQKQREQGEELNIQNNDITSIEERYSILMSCAYHLDMSGGTYHEKSFTYNKLLAIYASKIGDLDIAERCYKRAIFDAEYLGHIKDKMECLYYMTRNVYDIWGRYEEAASNYQSLLKYYDSINDSRMRVSILSNIAIIHDIKGELEQAMDLYKDSLETAMEIGDQVSISGSLNNIALIHDNKAEYDQALKLYNQSLELARKMGDQQGIARILNNIGNIHYKKGEYDQALKLYNQSLEIKRQIGDQKGIADALINTGLVHDKKGEYGQAMDLYNQSLEIERKMGDQQGIARILNNIGLIHYKNGEYDQALKLYNQSLEISRQIGYQQGIADTLHNIAMVHDDKGEYGQAMDLYNQSLEIERKMGDQQGIARILYNIAAVQIHSDQYEKSLFYILQARMILEGLDLPQQLQRSSNMLAYIEGKLGSEAYQRLVEKIKGQLS